MLPQPDLVSIVDAGLSESEGRVQALDVLKDYLARAHEEIRAAFEAGVDPRETMAAEAAAVDRAIRALLDYTVSRIFPAANPTTGDRLCLAAVGGYGRGALAPYSDIDLLFLWPYKKTPRSEQIVEYVLYMLWDTGLKVGHSTRSVDDCIRLGREDITIRTSLLESRRLWGDEALFDELRTRFADEIVAGTGPDFVEAKLAERDERHRRMGDSRYVVEPNVKEGKGGLRDLQTLFWIAKYLYRVDDIRELVPRVFTRGEMRRLDKAEAFLNTVRCHLHYLTGRPDDRLMFDVQIEIAARAGYTDHAGTRGVERFMKHYYLTAKDVGDLTRIFCAALEAEHQRKPRLAFMNFLSRTRTYEGFRTDGGRLTMEGPNAFREDPVKILRLFHTAQKHELDIHPAALRLITRNLRLIGPKLRDDPEANRLFLEMLTSKHDPETTLRRMSEAGVLGRFIEPFGRVVAQMQYDMYHVYTVDEHTIRAIGILHRIERGELEDSSPVASDIVKKVLSRRVLYVAVLLHDIAKGRGGDHSVIGARIARDLCPRLGLDEAETETVAWLVLHHLLMSKTAFKRDLNDPQTVRDFAAVVQSPERLRLLLVLTVADIRAVGPDVWNGWKAALLRDLYFKVDEYLSGAVAPERSKRVEGAKCVLRERLVGWSSEEFETYVGEVPAFYWLAWDADTLERHAHLVRRVQREGDQILIETQTDELRDVTEVTICTPDHPGLFSRLTGGLSVAGANIVEARIFTFLNGIALDTFWVQSGEDGPFDRPERLVKRMREALAGEIDPRRELRRKPPWPSRMNVFTVVPQVLIDNKASATHTLIEVTGRDRPGFLSDVTRAMNHLALQVSTARISTFGESAVDVFYVKDVFGLKIEHEGKLKQVREVLLAAIADPNAKPQPAEKRRRRPGSSPATAIPGRSASGARGKVRRR